MSTEENRLTLDTEGAVFFYEQDHYYLSNFSAFAIEWMGQLYPTAEHAYQAEKFRGTSQSVRDLILVARSAHEAFKLAEFHRNARRREWDGVKVGVMRQILREKVEQHGYVSRKLEETGNRELIENSWRDDYWGWGPDRKGMNMLGTLWMQVRADRRTRR